jgi:acyl-CoA reductase-like NAD-dependent aldehyde dehydrogenase
VKRAITKDGGSVAYGNTDCHYNGFDDNKELKNGNWVEPMIIEGIDTDSLTHQQEFLGPVFNLYKVITQKHALDLANKTDYGLSAAIYTEN